MRIHDELDELLAAPACHAILVNALDDYGAMLPGTEDSLADEYEIAYAERSRRHLDALRDVFERWP